MADTLLSMTGYGELSRDIGSRRWRCVVQSVNSRYLDCRMRIPNEYVSFEPVLRNIMKQSLIRGKIDLVLSYENILVEGGSTLPTLDADLIVDFCESGKGVLQGLGWSPEDPGFRRTILFHAIQQSLASQVSRNDDKVLIDELKLLVTDTLELHRQSCFDEGRELAEFFISAIDDLHHRMERISSLAADMPAVFKERLQERINRLMDKSLELDESRLCQEVAHQVDRSDISEEIVRFNSHLKQFREVVSVKGDLRKGKKLDFIIQELSREINTITAKANLLELTREAVEIKSHLEQIREQVQNVV